jgi:hypothetical protein
MDYILLPRGDWSKILPAFEQQKIPMPEMAVVAAAMNGSEVGGFLCLQPAMHAEPLWIDRPYRGKVDFRRLLKTAVSPMPASCPYYVFAPNRKIERMAEIANLTDMKYSVWRGLA